MSNLEPNPQNRDSEQGSGRKTSKQMKFNPWLMNLLECLVAGRETLWPGEFRWELDTVVHICNPSTPEVEARGLRFQDQPGLQTECLASG